MHSYFISIHSTVILLPSLGNIPMWLCDNVANIISMCIKDYDHNLFANMKPATKVYLKALFWIDAIGCSTKILVRMIDDRKALFRSGKSKPRDVASHVGKETRSHPAVEAITAQFPGTLHNNHVNSGHLL